MKENYSLLIHLCDVLSFFLACFVSYAFRQKAVNSSIFGTYPIRRSTAVNSLKMKLKMSKLSNRLGVQSVSRINSII